MSVPDAVLQEATRAILYADVEWSRGPRGATRAIWQTISSERAQALAEAAAPLIAAAVFHQIRELAKRTGAVATGSDGVTRLFADVMDREVPSG